MLTVQQQASVVATGAVALMAVAGISFSGISPGRMAAAVLIPVSYTQLDVYKRQAYTMSVEGEMAVP